MTVEDVEIAIARIENSKGDDEGAHGLEDQLHHDVLEAIAAGKAEDVRQMALLAIQTRNIRFSRWCA